MSLKRFAHSQADVITKFSYYDASEERSFHVRRHGLCQVVSVSSASVSINLFIVSCYVMMLMFFICIDKAHRGSLYIVFLSHVYIEHHVILYVRSCLLSLLQHIC